MKYEDFFFFLVFSLIWSENLVFPFVYTNFACKLLMQETSKQNHK